MHPSIPLLAVVTDPYIPGSFLNESGVVHVLLAVLCLVLSAVTMKHGSLLMMNLSPFLVESKPFNCDGETKGHQLPYR